MRFLLIGAALLLQATTPVTPVTVTSLHAGAWMPECSIDASVGTATCTNVLPENWRKSDYPLKELPDIVSAMLTGGPPSVTNNRKSAVLCRSFGKWRDIYNKQLTIKYSVPADLDKFPSGGTKGRDLVIGVFESQADSLCAEDTYSVRELEAGKWKRVIQFMTVRNRDATRHSNDEKVFIARWETWAISSNGLEYKLDKIDDGKWVSCKGNHQKGQMPGFIGCEGATAIDSYLDSLSKTLGVRNVQSFDDVLGQLNRAGAGAGAVKGVRAAFSLRDVWIFTDDAWGRCGNLGCCAAE